MKPYLLFAIVAGISWGVGGYFEKAGLRALNLPPITGITIRTAVALVILGAVSIPSWKSVEQAGSLASWLMIIIGGGIVAGSIGMWSFYSSLATTDNLGVTLAIAFACSSLAGTLLGVIKGTQDIDAQTMIGLVAIIAGIVLVQLAHRPAQ